MASPEVTNLTYDSAVIPCSINTVIVPGDDISWVFNRSFGFTMRVVVSLYPFDTSRYFDRIKWCRYDRFTAADEICRIIYADYRSIVGSICEKRKVNWNTVAFRSGTRDGIFYCHNIDWLVIARLQGHEELYNNVIRVEVCI